jgi:hypothetical protein
MTWWQRALGGVFFWSRWALEGLRWLMGLG